MTATLARRGPDGVGVWTAPHIALGHRRLAVPRGGSGEQPMTVATPGGQPAAIVFDGQVYNASVLRHELSALGHPFRTDGDAEVVLRGYLEWGDGLAERLTGMYAFAVWDGRSERLVMVRDRMGARPLYYYPLPGGVLFGSEPKAILAHPRALRAVNAAGMCEIFSGFNRTPGVGIWVGMRDLEHAAIVSVDASGISESGYWRLTAEPHTDDLEATIAKARDLLAECVRQQMPAEDSCCVLLSGGLDSSVLTGIAARIAGERGSKISSCTLDFSGQNEYYSATSEPAKYDMPFARDVAEHAHTEHNEIVLDPSAMADPGIRRACVEARDLPVGFGDRDMSLYLMCSMFRDHAVVALNGDGGGQAFGPYPEKGKDGGQKSDPRQLRRLPLGDDALVDPAFLEAIGRDDYARRRTAAALASAPVLEGESEMDRRVRMSYYLTLMRVPSWATSERRDRISSSCGVEIRTPYYDHRLIQYLFNTPWQMKIFDGMEKSLLRAVGGDLVPDSVRTRKKKGYPSIQHPGYTAMLQQQVGDVLRSGHDVLEFYDREQVRAAVSADPGSMSRSQQFGMERLLDLVIWADIRRPSFNL